MICRQQDIISASKTKAERSLQPQGCIKEFMENLKYPHLFEPTTVAGTLFRNRIFASATGFLDVIGNKEGGYYHTPEAAAYYERLAIGGAAVVTIGSCYVDKKYGDFGNYHVFMDDPFSLHSYYNIANSVTRHGAVASAELIHCGLYANRVQGLPAYGPVEMEDNGRPIYAMTEEYIEGLIDRFANAAAFAKKCGFSMITIHGGHGWLISQFVNPKLNTRKDKWGGPSIENRARLPVAICDAIRKKVGPKFPIEMRISGSEVYDGGYGIDEGIALAKQLDGHLDLIHVSAGSHERDEVFTVTHPSMFLPEGVNSIYAAEIKKNITKSKVVTVGGFSDPDLMEEMISSGKADYIAMARSLLADPDLPNKYRMGKEKDIKKCMRCLSCFSNEQTYGKLYCAINPKTGHEYEEKFDIPPAIKKRVLVVGGGIGGMQAALTCAERGHDVVLCEKTERLGGALRCEEKVPFKKNLDLYLNNQERAVKQNAAIELRLGTTVTPELAKSINADVIIAALGARPVKPPIKGIDGKNVIAAEDAYVNPEKTGNSVAILGGGLVGVELGIFLATMGRKVTIVEMLPSLTDGGNHLHAKALAVEIKKYNIDVNLSTKALEITDKGVIGENAEGQKLFEAETVIYAVGQAPLQGETMALHDCAPEFYVLGDCIVPKNVTNATSAGYQIARAIGRYGL
jgi:2,4-dienoyl-CoA reductase-like NADH-dependent reductase (Old Yellow Enzyme family)/thioredoxin reductase